jgi:uncharacterized membrane protein YhaH (DUF805 family)
MANRIGRVEYLVWNVVLALGLLFSLVLAFWLAHREEITHRIIEVALFAAFYFKLVVFAPRRLHDMNDSGWWALVLLIPLFDVAFDLVLLFKPGTRAVNAYGPVPRTWPWENNVRTPAP